MASLTALGWVLAAGALAAPSNEGVVVHGSGESRAVEAVEHQPLEADQLETLVGPVALYPDDLLAIVLPASTYPLQIVQADRYLKALEDDASLEPDEDWDQSVVALLNYPDVVTKLSSDLDWTWDLGQAVLNQEEEVIDAVERFRRGAHAAGNLASDQRQRVDVDEQTVEIRPADPEVIYVPYYDSSMVRARHSYPVYHYYPRPFPVYYYPYPSGHYLTSGYFWGVTSAFSIGWQTRHVHFHLHEHRSHPYFGRAYDHRHYRYWNPRPWAFTHYRDHRSARHHAGNHWRADRHHRGARPPHRERRERHDLPVTRPPAATGLHPRVRPERYRDDPATYRARSSGATVRPSLRAEPAPRTGQRAARERRTYHNAEGPRVRQQPHRRAEVVRERTVTPPATPARAPASRPAARPDRSDRADTAEARSSQRSTADIRRGKSDQRIRDVRHRPD
jgi:hypothetical protein